jgi:UDP-glucose 4-epimerase
MRILVTGGAGFVGSSVVRYLLEANHEVVILDDLFAGCAACVPEGVEFAVGDLGDATTLDRLLPGTDVVVHCAGSTESTTSIAAPGLTFAENVAKPLRLLEAMGRHEIELLAWCSCVDVYGDPDVVPVVEGAMTSPLTPLGESKLMFERMAGWFRRASDIRTATLRLSNVAGAWPDGSIGEARDPQIHLVPRVLEALDHGALEIVTPGGYPTPDGTPIRDYVHVHDVARAFGLVIDWMGGGGPGGTFNISSGRGHSAQEVVDAAEEITGGSIELAPGPEDPAEPAVLTVSFDLAERTFGWRPDRSQLHAIMTDAWKWQSAHPHGYEPTP